MTARAHPEDDFHVSLADLLTYGIAPPGVLSREGVVWTSHENRQSGVREGARRKKRGVVAGVPDVQFVFGGRSYWVELKVPGGYPSQVQRALHDALRAAGCEVAVARNLAQVVSALHGWGVPTRLGAVA